MLEADGWMFPDGERHMLEWMATPANRLQLNGRSTYQGRKQAQALLLCPHDRRRAAVDVGAHIGLWSWNLSHWFDHVHAFEPVPEHRECFAYNLQSRINVTIYAYALGEREDSVALSVNPTSSGDSWIKGKGDVPMKTLDSFALPGPIDLLKIDCEGYEEFVLRGATELLTRDRPVIVVEQKRDFATKFGLKPQGALDYLKQHGYRQALEMAGDYFMVPE